MSNSSHSGKPTSIYLDENVKYILDKIIIPQRKRIDAKASRSKFINQVFTNYFIKKGYLNRDGSLKNK